MMKRVKRVLACLLVIATVFAFTPFFSGDQGAAYASSKKYDQQWVRDSIKGLHKGYAVAGTRLHFYDLELMDHLGLNMAFADEVGVTFYYYNGSTTSTSSSSLEDFTYFDVPSSATSDCKIWVCIEYKGTYYYSNDKYKVTCMPAKVNSKIMEDKGSLVITLGGVGNTISLPSSVDPDALNNTMEILEGNTSVTCDACYAGDQRLFEYDYDGNGTNDFVLEDYEYGDIEQFRYARALTDYTELGKIKIERKVASGWDLPPYLLGGETNKGYPYYSTLAFRFPRSLKNASITMSPSSGTLVYTGKARIPGFTVKYNGTKLTKGTSYKVSGSRVSIGPGTATITGMGNYTGTVKKSFKIVPDKVTISSITGGTKQFTVKWGAKPGGVKYQIKYRVKGTSTWKNTTSTTTSKTVKNLSKGKTYEVKVRAYKTVSGTNYYGAFSAVKTVKVK